MSSFRKLNGTELKQLANDAFPKETNTTIANNIIVGYITFAKFPEFAKLRDLLLLTVKQFSRLTSVPDLEGNWHPVENLDVDYHIVEEKVNDIKQRKHEMLQEDIDLSKPLWRAHILVTPHGEKCFVLRLHHCLGDGFRLAKILDAMAENEQGEPANFLAQSQKKFGGKSMGFFQKLGLALNVIPSFFAVLLKGALGYESEFAGHTSLQERKDKMPCRKRVLIDLPTLSLEEVKQVKSAFNGSVNDALFLWMTGSYRRYAQARGDPLITDEVSKIVARSLVPVAFPDEKEWRTGSDVLSNRFCFVSVDVPLQYPAVEDRLQRIRKAFDYLKTSSFPCVSLWLADTICRFASVKFSQNTVADLFSKHTNVFSNVPGPEKAVYICGEKVESISSSYNNIITQFLLVSYNGKIFGTLVADPDVLEPELTAKSFTEEWDALKEHYISAPIAAPSSDETLRRRKNKGNEI